MGNCLGGIKELKDNAGKCFKFPWPRKRLVGREDYAFLKDVSDDLHGLSISDETTSIAKVDECFTPLSDADTATVGRVWSGDSDYNGRVLVTHVKSNIDITAEILRCLMPTNWLCDEVINVYLSLLKEREEMEPLKFLRCHFFNTFFYSKLLRSGRYNYQSVKKWTTLSKLGYSLLDCDLIFIPVHRGMHWSLGIINRKDENFQYLDSLKSNDHGVLDILAQYYVDEAKDKSGKEIDVSNWKKVVVNDIPSQRNGDDCGVFMIKYVDFCSRGAKICFSQHHIPYFRMRTALEILKLRAE